MAVHQGIYVSPMEVKPNRDIIKKASISDKKIWLIEYEVKNYSKGAAIIRAKDPTEAETLLKSQGAFSGLNYSINRIVEIPLSTSSKVLWEQSINYLEPN